MSSTSPGAAPGKGTNEKTVLGSATARAEPGFAAASWTTDSPWSGAKASTYTRAFTFGLPVAALVTTAPPYEWPTSTIGPGMVCR